ncbi:MAG: hypothetical protein H6598_08040 [Flavobacteriales bacterium]|nr:hypothetical protein [Flavobacteriales bacterium]
MKHLVLTFFLVLGFFIQGQTLIGEWHFTEGFYDSGDKHFGRIALVFNGDEVEYRGFKLIDQSFADESIAFKVKGTYQVIQDELILNFPKDNGMISEQIIYRLHFENDTTIYLKNETYGKTYIYHKV